MKVLLAIDESKFSEAAAQALISQFRPQETEVRVLHVVEPIAIPVPPEMPVEYLAELKGQLEMAQELVEQVAKTLRAADFRVTAAVEKGDAKSVIVDQAAAWPADLILVGSHGRKGLARFLMGSVSEAVARHAPCSVQVVRNAALLGA